MKRLERKSKNVVDARNVSKSMKNVRNLVDKIPSSKSKRQNKIMMPGDMADPVFNNKTSFNSGLKDPAPKSFTKKKSRRGS